MGETNILACDPDRWSYFEILSVLKEMGYINVKERWCSVGGGSVLEGRLELLSDDKGASHMVNIGILNGQVHLYVVHMVSEPQIVHLLEYCGNEVAADAEVSVEGGGIAAGVEVGKDARIGAAPEVDVEVGIADAAEVGEDSGIGAALEVDVEVGIAGAAEVREDYGIGGDLEVGVECENKSAEEVGVEAKALTSLTKAKLI